MSISQHLTTLYTLKMKAADTPTLLPLNRYARSAIKELTNDYDEELYNDFMNAWGTHIAVSTEIGGMKEQQMIFKDCIFRTANITDGIPEEELLKNLKQELLANPPCLTYYYAVRRMKPVDHFIGGNMLAVSDTALWQKSIVQDPALLRVLQYVPWYDVIENPTKKENLRQAIIKRYNRTNEERIARASKVRELRTNLTVQAKHVVYRLSNNNFSFETSDTITLADSYQCPTGLTKEELIQWCR
ncbi:unnamed protein product, partial [Didymodactylos carnosus]